MLDAVIPADDQPAVQIDKVIELRGHHLVAKPATSRTVLLSNDRFDINESVVATDPPPSPKNSATSIMFTIPMASAGPSGVRWRPVRLRMKQGAQPTGCATLAPTITL
jgi:hypothetical protein